MFLGKRFTWQSIWHFTHKALIVSACISTAVVLLYEVVGLKFVAIPFLPVATIGTAVAFYIGFKNNQAYSRLWEARTLWGGITNTSRSLGLFINNLPIDKSVKREIIYRHIAYVNILRLQLRRRNAWDAHLTFLSGNMAPETYQEGVETTLKKFTSTQVYESLHQKNHVANALLNLQSQQISLLKSRGIIDGHEQYALTEFITDLLAKQGGNERIKTFPLPKQYSLFSSLFVWLFIVLLPMGIIKELADKTALIGVWLTIPFSMLISWVFYSMEMVGDSSQNPFENAINDVPLSAICRNIEIDLKEILGETDLPAKLQPVHDILM